MHYRATKITLLVAAATIILSSLAIAQANCNVYTGDFTAVAPATCSSPVGICTHGTLTGQFPSTYDFSVDTLVPANDPASPNKFLYTGHSTITAADGAQMFGHDSGFLYIEADGHAPFVTTVKIAGGNQEFSHVSGKFVAPGVLHLADGSTDGTYTATICHGNSGNDD